MTLSVMYVLRPAFHPLLPATIQEANADRSARLTALADMVDLLSFCCCMVLYSLLIQSSDAKCVHQSMKLQSGNDWHLEY